MPGTNHKEQIKLNKIKSLSRDISDRIFSVDRGGVEPLERVDKTAPETLRTRPSNPRKYPISIQIKRKAPLQELFGVANDFVHSGLVNLNTIIRPLKQMSTGLSIIVFIFFTLVVVAPLAFAGTSYNLLQPLPTTGDNPDFGYYMEGLIRFLVLLSAVAAVVMITIGGVLYAFSEALETQKTARSMISDALLGLIIALLSYLILYTINPDLVNLKLTIPGLPRSGQANTQQSVSNSTNSPGGPVRPVTTSTTQCGYVRQADCQADPACTWNVIQGRTVQCINNSSVTRLMKQNEPCTSTPQCQPPLQCLQPSARNPNRICTVPSASSQTQQTQSTSQTQSTQQNQPTTQTQLTAGARCTGPGDTRCPSSLGLTCELTCSGTARNVSSCPGWVRGENYYTCR